MRIRSVWFLLGELFQRRTAAAEPLAAPAQDCDSHPFRFTELVASASILDFGGWPIEWPPIGDCSSSGRPRSPDERGAF